MRVVVHDYSGHAFPIQLSRTLAERGHQVLHLYSSSFTTPQGPLARRPDDSPNLQIEAIALAERVDKVNLLKRRQADIEHGRRVAERIKTFQPQAVLSGNTPLDAQKLIQTATRSQGAKFIFWVQDLIGQAALRLLRDKFAGAGRLVGAHYIRMENRMLEQSDKIVVISEDFRPHLPARVRNTPKVEVVENWALIDEIPLLARENAWCAEQGFGEGLNFVYSGTLGMKHNPGLLVRLAGELSGLGRMVVISEGASVEFLRSEGARLGLGNLVTLPFQPFERMPEVLATADVLVAILEPDAGVFSVPSKVFNYLCAGKPILMAVPKENLVARIVAANNAGRVVAPDDADGFLAAAKEIAQSAELRSAMGAGARAYAERTFDIAVIADKFDSILKS